MNFINISRKVVTTVKLNDSEMQVLFNALSVYKKTCEDFHFVCHPECSCEYVKLAETISDIRSKLFLLL